MAPQNSSVFPQLLPSEEYSDFALVCQGQQFYLHKAIVCPQSPVIARALKGGFQEARTKVLNVKAFDIATVQRMVTFMYTKEYEVDVIKEISGSNTGHKTGLSQPQTNVTGCHPPFQQPDMADMSEVLLRHVRVNAIADYYNIQKLKDLANSKIQCILRDRWQAESFCGVVGEVLCSTGDVVLQEIISSTAADRIGELVASQSFSELEEMSDFSIKVLGGCAQRIHELESQLEYSRSVCKKEAVRADRIINNVDNCLRILSACINDLVVIQGELS